MFSTSKLVMDTHTLVSLLEQLGLGPQDETARRGVVLLSQKHAADLRGFCRELLQRGLLTAYQVNLLLTGKGQQLLIGPYVVQERLGEGGMGQVFKARHRQMSIPVALKVIRPDRAVNPIALGRFLREVHAAAQLNDPNVVRAYDAACADGVYYFAMEFVQGTDLAAYVRSRGPLPIEMACQFLRQAALGLRHIHEHGMVHRDIKPGNLMLALEEAPTAVGPAGLAVGTVPAVLKILDLGLARLREERLQGESEDTEPKLSLTHEGIILGSVDYMAPEQARDSRAADIRSDIYSLGCTLYYVLTGQVPFPGGSTVEKILRHQSAEPAALDRFRPHVPPLLADILKKMMAKEARNRYQTPGAVAAALAPLVAGDSGPPPLAIPVPQADEQTLSDTGGGTTAPDQVLVPKATGGHRPYQGLIVAVGVVLAVGALLAVLLVAVLLRALW